MLPSAADAYTALQSFKPQNPQDVVNNANTQAGVNDAQTRVSDLRGAVNNLSTSLNAVDPSVTGRTTGTFTTEGQRQALVSKEQAPIQTNLNARNQDLNFATSNLGDAQSRAGTLAAAILSSDKDTYQKLLDQYNASAASEKDAEAKRQFDAGQSLEQQKLAETAREANLTASSKTNTGIDLSGILSTLMGGGSGATMSQRTGGGFNFSDTSGNAISAGKYASASGTPIGTLLYNMGTKGDAYAMQAYNQIKANQAYYNSNPNVLKSEFPSLFWGT